MTTNRPGDPLVHSAAGCAREHAGVIASVGAMVNGPKELTELLERQSGVIARRQLVELGTSPQAIRRWLRRRDLVVVTRGVYVDHTGPLTWSQRCWVAVQHCWPAVLAGEAALLAARREDGRPDQAVEVAIAAHRTKLVVPAWVRVSWRTDLDRIAHWHRDPPRLRYEEATVDLAMAAHDDFAAIAVLAGAVQSRRTTAERLSRTIRLRARVRRRSFLIAVLDDVASGACSALERSYLVDVERAHGLPVGDRQGGPRGVYRDVQYGGLVVELDGRVFHDSAQSFDHDLDRDLDTALERRQTVRIGWGQVTRRPCRTAARLVLLLRDHGTVVDPRPCSPGCELAA